MRQRAIQIAKWVYAPLGDVIISRHGTETASVDYEAVWLWFSACKLAKFRKIS